MIATPLQAQQIADAESDLPEGWTPTTIGQACEINPPKPSKNALPPDAAVTFVPMPAVDADLGAITAPSERPFAEVRSGYTAFRDGDVIMAKITPCMENGKAAIVREMRNGLGFGSTEFHVLRPNGTALAEYLYYYIRQEWFRTAAEAEMTGSVGQRRVPVEFLSNSPIPLPPLAEQDRIVAQVETLLVGLQSTRERLAKVPLIMKRFRQSVLAAACSGNLTEDWRADPRSLLSYGKVPDPAPESLVGSAEDLPSGWCSTTLGGLVKSVTSGSRGWAKYYSAEGPLFIRAQDINTDYLRLDDVARVDPPAGAERERTRAKKGDLLVTITGANVTRTALVDFELPEAYVSQHVGLLRLSEPKLGRFLHLWLTSPVHGRAQLLDAAYGAGKPGLNLENLRAVTVFLPPFVEQVELIRRVDALFSLANAVAGRIAAAAARAEKIEQAVLAKAFRGELVPTEAGLMRQDGRG